MAFVFPGKVTYNLHRGNFGYSRRQLHFSLSGANAGRTESAVMRRLKEIHGHDAEITILSIDWR